MHYGGSLKVLNKIAKTRFWQDWEIITIISVTITLLLISTGLENEIAHKVYNLKNPWAWWMREYATIPAIFVSIISLIFLLIPKLRKRYSGLRRLAAVWLLTALLGAGLVNQVIINSAVERPRPRDSILLADTMEASLVGHSFPSGHAAIGFIFVVPFFVWRNRNRKLARTALLIGLSWGCLVGYARMVAGAHFATDVLWAGAITLMSASLFAELYKGRKDIPTHLTAGILLFAMLCMALFNKFSINLHWEGTTLGDIIVEVPCKSFYINNGDKLTVDVELSGYGAPLTNLKLKQDGNRVYLQRRQGIYHSLECTMHVEAPIDINVSVK